MLDFGSNFVGFFGIVSLTSWVAVVVAAVSFVLAQAAEPSAECIRRDPGDYMGYRLRA